ncbi:MAG: tryptophan synthase subunit alpha [Desulfovibrio sp.]|nr:tryptophan synthase subunit alpha [Desulfovibrio sp.]
MHILEEKIRSANSQGRLALIPFLTAGFPDRSTFWPTLMELDENGADIIEIGVPFSDPVADGPVVEAASKQALSEGVNLREILQELKERRGLVRAGLVLMGYYNPFLQYGLEAFARDAKQAGVHGVIVPDLPLEESQPLRACLRAEGLALINLVGPNTTSERMRQYASESEGYVYVVSVLGVTGARKELPAELCETLKRARSCFSLPIALGFGLKEPAQLSGLPAESKPDAVIFGSAFLRSLSEGHSVQEFLSVWK